MNGYRVTSGPSLVDVIDSLSQRPGSRPVRFSLRGPRVMDNGTFEGHITGLRLVEDHSDLIDLWVVGMEYTDQWVLRVTRSFSDGEVLGTYGIDRVTWYPDHSIAAWTEVAVLPTNVDELALLASFLKGKTHRVAYDEDGITYLADISAFSLDRAAPPSMRGLLGGQLISGDEVQLMVNYTQGTCDLLTLQERSALSPA